MMKRTVTLVLGDWGEDGHRESDSFRVRIIGEDVSNERLKIAKDAAVKASGVEIERLFEDYEDGSISSDVKDDLENAGIFLTPVDPHNHSAPEKRAFSVDDYGFNSDHCQEKYFDAVALMMEFLGYGIEGFRYKVIEDDIIVGGPDAVVNSYGYGLYGR